MKLAYWMYAGPAHIGTLRVASSFKNVHAIMHAPLGDDYFNVMRSMLERERDFTPVTASIVDRHVLARGSQEKVVENIQRKDKEERPDLILLTPTCTSSILQEDLQNFVSGAKNTSNCDVLLADVNHYRVNELQAADRTLEQIVRFYLDPVKPFFLGENLSDTPYGDPTEAPPVGGLTINPPIRGLVANQLISHSSEKKRNNENEQKTGKEETKNMYLMKTEKPSANIIGMFTLGFHNQHDCRELKRLLNSLGILVNEIIPEGCYVSNLKNLPKAWFNIVPYREVGLMTAIYLEKQFNMPYTSITPMGIVDTALFIREVKTICEKINKEAVREAHQYLLGRCPGAWEQELVGAKRPLDGLISTSVRFAHPRPAGLAAPLARGGQDATDSLCPQFLSMKENQLNVELGARSYGEAHPIYLSQYIPSHESLILNEQKVEEFINIQTKYVSQAAWFSRSIDCQNLTGKKAVVFGDATHAASMTKILVREMGINVVCAGTYCKHDADWFREQVSGFCSQVLITDDHSQIGDIISILEPAAIFGTQMERHVGKRLDIPCGVISAPVHIQNFPLGFKPFLGYEGANQISDLVYNSFSLGMEDHLLEIFNGHDNKEVITRSYSENELEWTTEAKSELNKVPGFVRAKVKRNTEKYAQSIKKSVITLSIMYAAKEALSN